MTEGIPASNSMTLFMKVEAFPCRKYSPKKIETGSEKTMEMSKAIKELTKVPTRKAKAPNSPRTGSQVFPIRKLKPNWRRAGTEEITREKKMAIRRKIRMRPAK
jgi:hypothetical protein